MSESLRDAFRNAFSKKLTWIGLIAIPLIVGLFALLYVNTFSDPYERLKEMPVALVNEDAGATVDGEAVNYGADLAASILENDSVAWQEWHGDLEQSDYAMGVVIPEDFSERVAAGKTSAPETAGLTFYHNMRKNFMLSVLSSRIESELETIVNEEVGKQYTEALAQGLVDAEDGFAEAEEGASELSDGAKDLAEGADALNEGADDLKAGISQMAEGANTLAAGTERLSGEAEKIPRGAAKLSAGVSSLGSRISDAAISSEKLAEGAKTLAQGASKMDSSLASALEGAAALEDALKEGGGISSGAAASVAFAEGAQSFAAQGKDAAASALALVQAGRADEAVALLQTLESSLEGFESTSGAALDAARRTSVGVSQLSSGAADLKSGMGELKDAAGALAQGASALDEGARELSKGLGQGTDALSSVTSGLEELVTGGYALSSGIEQIDGGAKDLASGASSTEEGTSSLAAGATSLKEGSDALRDGSLQLEEGLGEGASAIRDSLTATPAAYASYIAEPVEVDDATFGELDSFGYGFAPLFMTISLWLGSLLLFFIFDPFPPYGHLGDGRIRAVIGRWPVYLVLALPNAAVVCVGCMLLGVPHVDLATYICMCVGTSFSFMCILQLFSLFDIPGKAVAIIILIFQVVCCSGTFPAFLGAPYAQAIEPWLPFTYAIDGFREAMSGNSIIVAWQDIGMLILFALACVLLSLLIYPKALKIKKRRDEETITSITAYDGAHAKAPDDSRLASFIKTKMRSASQ